MDSKLYFVSSIVVIELIRLFRIRPTDTNSHALKKQQVATVTELTDKEIAAQAEDKQVSDLVTALRVVPHPEGGYFRETYRSGAEPMASKGKTDEDGDLITTSTMRPEKGANSSSCSSNSSSSLKSDRDDDRSGGGGGGDGSSDDEVGSTVRNQMTSMIFMATRDAPILYFGINKSDHVHYFHGPPGCSYTYVVVYPCGEVKELTLGCDVKNNESLQIVFPRGCFKAGHLNGSHCLIGEGVAPGFDFRDFSFCDEVMLEQRLGQKSSGDNGSSGSGSSGGGKNVIEYLMKKYVKYVKPDRRRNFDDYYLKKNKKPEEGSE